MRCQGCSHLGSPITWPLLQMRPASTQAQQRAGESSTALSIIPMRRCQRSATSMASKRVTATFTCTSSGQGTMRRQGRTQRSLCGHGSA